jgi:integrase
MTKALEFEFAPFIRLPEGGYQVGGVGSSPGHQTRNAHQKRISGHKRDTNLKAILGTQYRLAKLADRGGDLSKEWYVYYSVINPESQRWERIRIKGQINREKTERARKNIAAKLISAINKLLSSGWTPYNSEHAPANVLTLGALLDKAIRHKVGTVTDKTLSSYGIAVNKLIKFAERKKIAALPCTYLTTHHLLALRDEMVASGAAAKTINVNMQHLASLWKTAIERGDVTVNPFKGVKELRETESNKNVPLSTEELSRVSQHLQAKHPGLLLLCRFIYGSAVRPLECLGIRREHVDFENGILRLPGTISKNKLSQVVDLPGEILEQLRAIGFEGMPAGTLLFSGRQLQPGHTVLHRNRVSEMWKQLVRIELGIDKDMYSLKHKGAIDLVNTGVDIKKIQVYMRHSSLDITDKYLRTLTGQRLEAVRTRKLAL